MDKYIEICTKECKLLDAKALQLMKDYTVKNAREAIKFYVDMMHSQNTSKHHLSLERL